MTKSHLKNKNITKIKTYKIKYTANKNLQNKN